MGLRYPQYGEMGLKQVEHGFFFIFCQIFGIFDGFSKWSVPISPWHFQNPKPRFQVPDPSLDSTQAQKNSTIIIECISSEDHIYTYKINCSPFSTFLNFWTHELSPSLTIIPSAPLDPLSNSTDTELSHSTYFLWQRISSRQIEHLLLEMLKLAKATMWKRGSFLPRQHAIYYRKSRGSPFSFVCQSRGEYAVW